MNRDPQPPAVYEAFVERYTELERAWQLIAEAGRSGPFDLRTRRLVRLGIAVGALRRGAVRGSVRKGLARGISPAEIEHVVALAAGTIGLPAAVAAFSWIRDCLEREASRPEVQPQASPGP
jgi:alkylhydroperoxidase/carboxymuconolactone decarboxylase family protein YurZ